jgi:hypothetical protein
MLPAAQTISIAVDELNDLTDDLWTLTMLGSDFARLALGSPIWVWEDVQDAHGGPAVSFVESDSGDPCGRRLHQ